MELETDKGGGDMQRLKGVLLRFQRLLWVPRRKYAYLCQRSGFYR